MLTDQTIDRIRRFAADRKLTRNQLAKMSGLHWHSLRDMEKAGWNPTVSTLRKLEELVPPDFMPGLKS